MSLEHWTPYYQRLIQRASAYTPKQNRIVNNVLSNQAFQQMAGEDAMNVIQQMRLAANKLAQDRNLQLTAEQDAYQSDFRNRKAKSEASDASKATTLAGVGLAGDLITSGVNAYSKRKQADRMDDLTRRLFRGAK